MTRSIVHVDMDAFFAAIEERDDPSLAGRPVVVGADPKSGKGRGVVSTCSYEARRFGIRSAMPISAAYRRCPQAIFLPVDMEKYVSVSRQIFRILYSFTPDIEPVSIDEAFLDITGSRRLFGAPLETCRMIKAKIRDETALTASIGLAPTMMAAKIASDLEKPDGLVEVGEKELPGFLRPLDIRKIWGLGEKSAQAMNRMGITTIGELADSACEVITGVFGKNGVSFWRLANGIDERAVSPGGEAKSVSCEETFEKDTLDADEINATLLALCENISARMRRDGVRSRTITLKVRTKDFRTFTRSVTRIEATNFEDVLYNEIKNLYNNFVGTNRARLLRLVGVRASTLLPAGRREGLFGDSDRKTESLHCAIDRIKYRYGDSSIFRAGVKLKRNNRYA